MSIRLATKNFPEFTLLRVLVELMPWAANALGVLNAADIDTSGGKRSRNRGTGDRNSFRAGKVERTRAPFPVGDRRSNSVDAEGILNSLLGLLLRRR